MLALFCSWSGDIPDRGAGSAAVFPLGEPPRGMLSQALCCVQAVLGKSTCKVTYSLTSQDFWKDGMYCLFNRPSCFYLRGWS